MELAEEYIVTQNIRRAVAADFKYYRDGQQYARYGTIYTIALPDGNFSYFRVFNERTDLKEIAHGLKEGILYVPGVLIYDKESYNHAHIQES